MAFVPDLPVIVSGFVSRIVDRTKKEDGSVYARQVTLMNGNSSAARVVTVFTRDSQVTASLSPGDQVAWFVRPTFNQGSNGGRIFEDNLFVGVVDAASVAELQSVVDAQLAAKA